MQLLLSIADLAPLSPSDVVPLAKAVGVAGVCCRAEAAGTLRDAGLAPAVVTAVLPGKDIATVSPLLDSARQAGASLLILTVPDLHDLLHHPARLGAWAGLLRSHADEAAEHGIGIAIEALSAAGRPGPMAGDPRPSGLDRSGRQPPAHLQGNLQPRDLWTVLDFIDHPAVGALASNRPGLASPADAALTVPLLASKLKAVRLGWRPPAADESVSLRYWVTRLRGVGYRGPLLLSPALLDTATLQADVAAIRDLVTPPPPAKPKPAPKAAKT